MSRAKANWEPWGNSRALLGRRGKALVAAVDGWLRK